MVTSLESLPLLDCFGINQSHIFTNSSDIIIATYIIYTVPDDFPIRIKSNLYIPFTPKSDTVFLWQDGSQSWGDWYQEHEKHTKLSPPPTVGFGPLLFIFSDIIGVPFHIFGITLSSV
jgi:hypothetical protein